MKKEKTCEIITDSLYSLLKKNPFQKITVQMICDASGISKATFYRLFSDKYDVMNEFFRIRCDRLIADNPGTRNCLRFLEGYASLITTYKDYFRAVLSTEGQNSFWDYLFECGMNYYIGNIERETGQPVSDVLRIQIELFTSGTVYITKKWIDGSLVVSEEQLSEIVYDAMPREMVRYYHVED